jgi:cholesterol oxidase
MPSGILPVPHRQLRLPEEVVHDVTASDGREIRLTRYHAGDKGPVVLAPGYGTSSLAWTIDTVETNFPEHLAEHGYDVWLLDYRASPMLAAASTDYTIDDIATKDWPAAIAEVREVSGADSVQVVPHCVGSMSFLMAMTAGMDGVRSAICSQLGLHPVPVLLNRAKAQARLATLMHGVGIERLTTTFNSAAFEDRALEKVMRHWPTREKCDSEVCHRILFIYGEVFDHDQLNEATHDAIVHIFGKTRLTAFRHLTAMIRKGHAVDAEGDEAYLPHLDRLAFPITFLHGEHNRMFVPRSTELTYDALRAANGDELYRRLVVRDYAHMDCWIGEHAARDVFPMALDELERFN